MPKITITPIKDENEIEILLNRYYDQPTVELLKKNFKLKDSYYLIATQNNEFVGFCSIDRDWWEDNYFFIREILIDPNFQTKF